MSHRESGFQLSPYIEMKTENQNVVVGKSTQQRLMFVHISAKSNPMA
jgi:hypothetical protein